VNGTDCASGVCQDFICQKATHSDGVKNDSETGVDCGYPEAPAHSCEDGEGCFASDDCASFVCYGGTCNPPTCSDSVMNGLETGVDCGVGIENCPPCQP
jgi:hypothetical protein